MHYRSNSMEGKEIKLLKQGIQMRAELFGLMKKAAVNRDTKLYNAYGLACEMYVRDAEGVLPDLAAAYYGRGRARDLIHGALKEYRSQKGEEVQGHAKETAAKSQVARDRKRKTA